MAIAGRFSLGMVVDRLNPRLSRRPHWRARRRRYSTILQTDNAPSCWPPVPCSAFRSATHHLPPLIIHREFSAASFTVVMGLSNAISGTIGALGPGLVGLVRGWSGDYRMALDALHRAGTRRRCDRARAAACRAGGGRVAAEERRVSLLAPSFRERSATDQTRKFELTDAQLRTEFVASHRPGMTRQRAVSSTSSYHPAPAAAS